MRDGPWVLMIIFDHPNEAPCIRRFVREFNERGIATHCVAWNAESIYEELISAFSDPQLYCVFSSTHAAFLIDFAGRRINEISTRPVVYLLYDSPLIHTESFSVNTYENVILAATQERISLFRRFFVPDMPAAITWVAEPFGDTAPAVLEETTFLAKTKRVFCAINLHVNDNTLESVTASIGRMSKPLRDITWATVDHVRAGADHAYLHDVVGGISEFLGIALTDGEFRTVLTQADLYIKMWRRHEIVRRLASDPDLPILFRGATFPPSVIAAAEHKFDITGPVPDYEPMVEGIRSSRVSLSVTMARADLLCERVLIAARHGTVPVTNANAMIEHCFTPGDDIMTYCFDDRLAERLKELIHSPEECFRIAANANKNIQRGLVGDLIGRSFVDDLIDLIGPPGGA